MRRPKGSSLWALVLLMLPAMALPSNLRAQGNFVYTNDDIPGPNTVSGFSVASSGALTPVPGSPFLTGGSGSTGFFASNRVKATTGGGFVFASNSLSNDVSVFTVDTTTGGLTLVPGSPFPTGGSVDHRGIALSATPNGKFLVAANSGSSNLTVFSVAGSGALTAIPGSPFPALSPPDGIKISSDGRFLAVGEPVANQVEMFNIGSDGSLASVGAFPGLGGGVLAGVDMSCGPEWLYGGKASPTTAVVDGYSIAPGMGSLTPIPGSPFKPGVGVNSNVVLLGKPQGPHQNDTLFVSNQASDTITVFTVTPDSGFLTLVPGSPFPMNAPVIGPSGMATSKDGSLLYVASLPNHVSVFSVGSTGALTEVAGSPFSTGRPSGLLSLTAFPERKCP